MRRSNIIREGFKYAVLGLFLSYYCCISFFSHSHIVNGVTIVHSHPFKQSKEAQNPHEHAASQIQLIAQLSNFITSGEASTALLDVYLSGGDAGLADLLFVVFPCRNFNTSQLRGPPVFVG